jgi:gliding motility-associated-like protein
VSDEIFVDICPPVIDFPNAFTPNGDGLNDTFGPVLTNMIIQSIQIYNRWGELIFEGRTPEFQWDDNYLSKPAPAGIYAYRILYSPYAANGKLFSQKGCLLLVR